jgi:membrane dipeptidase
MRFAVADAHADCLGDVVAGRRRLGDGGPGGQVDFPRLRQGGVRLQVLSLWVEPDYKPQRALGRLLTYLHWAFRELDANPEVRLVTDLGALEAVWGESGLGVMLAVEGAEAVGEEVDRVEVLARLGVRMLSLTWNQRNALADGAGEDPGGGGLSRLGRAVVRRMNQLGMAVDVSHLSQAAFWDVWAVSTHPPIASHANCGRLAPHPRNLTDRQIRALGDGGGVMGITFVRPFLGGAADLARVGDHILHALSVMGHDRGVGLGSDFDGVENPVPGLEDCARLPDLADHLLGRGLSTTTVGRVMGENWVSFFRALWTSTPPPLGWAMRPPASAPSQAG